MEKLTFVVPTLLGVEGLTADELRRMGMAETRAENGRVLCQGVAKDIPRLNLRLRTGERVLLLVGSFPARSFEELFQGVQALPWERWIPQGGQFPVKGYSLNSVLHSVPACQSIVKKAVATRLGRVYHRETLPEEYALLAENHMGISHCPAPTMLGGSEILDIPGMRKAGIPISLGVDGCATNDGSNMLDTLRLAYLMQTFLSKKRGGCPSPYEMLKLATVGGAEMIGRPELGQLAAGKAADLFMIDSQRLEYAGALHDPASMLAKLGVTGPVWLTMINGRVVYRDDHLTGVDEAKLLQEGEQVCTRVLRDTCEAFAPYRRNPQ